MNNKYNVFPNLIKCRKLLKFAQSDKERGEFDFKLTEMLAIRKFINDELQMNLTLDELFIPKKIV